MSVTAYVGYNTDTNESESMVPLRDFETLEKQLDEQCRINGMGQERELKLMTELVTLKSQLAKAEEVIAFYASLDSWFTHPMSGRAAHRICIDHKDVESFEKRSAQKLESQFESGGKRARTYLAQRKAE